MSEQKKKIILAAVGGVLLLFLFVGGCAAMSQRDAGPNSALPPSAQTSSEQEDVSSSETSSTPEPEKKPDEVVVPAALTRGEFAALLANKLNVTVNSEVKNVFPDMESHFAKKPVLALLQLGILSEDDYSGSFAPKTPITRMEAVKLLVIAMDGEADADKFEGKTSFADDGKIPQELKGYAAIAETLGLPVRFTDDTLRPDALCVREEAVALIAKVDAKKLTIVGEGTTEDKKEDATSKPDSSSKPGTSGKPSTPGKPTTPTTPTKPAAPAAAAKVSFELPKTAHTDTKAELNSSFENTTKLVWELKKDGRSVDVEDYIDGDPSKDKSILFTETGSYELTLKATGKDGKVVTVSRKTTIYPEITLNLSLPTKAAVNESVDAKLRVYGNEDDREINWKLRRDGRTVAIDDYADYSLYEDGGDISFNEDGRYELIATVKDKTGRVFSSKDTITVREDSSSSKPEAVKPTFSVDIPATARVGSSIAVHTQYANLNGYEVSWELYTAKGFESDWRGFVEGMLDKNGGTLRFIKEGAYTLQAVVKNKAGVVIRAKGSINISAVELPPEEKPEPPAQNQPPKAPIVIAEVTRHVKDGKFFVDFSEESTDPEGDAITFEYADHAADNYYPVGDHTIKVRAKDSKGAYSAWSAVRFAVRNRAPSVPVVSVDMNELYGEMMVTITAEARDPDGDHFTLAWEGRAGETAAYPAGNHTVRVRAVDDAGAASEWAEATFLIQAPAPQLLDSGESPIVPSPLGEQEGHTGRTESSPVRRTVSEANSAISAEIACD